MTSLSMSGFDVPGKGKYITLASADKTFEAHVSRPPHFAKIRPSIPCRMILILEGKELKT